MPTRRGCSRRYRLPLDPAAVAGTLSVAARQLVEIARALSSSARILTLDEPTAVLSAEERARLFDIVAELKRRGLLVLFVSHRLDEVFEIADRVTVLRNGRRVFAAPDRGRDAGRAGAPHGRPRRRRSDAGRAARSLRRAAAGDQRRRPRRSRSSVRLEPGEIVGLGGLVGSGPEPAGAPARRAGRGRDGRLPDRRAALQRPHARCRRSPTASST